MLIALRGYRVKCRLGSVLLQLGNDAALLKDNSLPR